MELSFTEGALFVVLDPFKHIQAHSLCLGSDTRDAPLDLQYYGIFGRQSTLFKLLHVLLGSEVVKSSMRPHRVPCILPLLYLPLHHRQEGMAVPLLVKLSFICHMGDLNVRILLGRPWVDEVVWQTQLLAKILKFL